MTLKQYLKQLSTQSAVAEGKSAGDDFARRCETSLGHLKQIAAGHRKANPALAINIERESGGTVVCESVRPDVDWSYIRSTQSIPHQPQTGT